MTDCFEDMLQRSIPQYDVMRRAVFDVGSYVLHRRRTSCVHVADLGSSQGSAVAPFIDAFPHGNFSLSEVSRPMLASLRSRFGEMGNVTVQDLDLREKYPSGKFDLVLSVLTLIFIPINYRQRLLSRVFESLNPGGAFICVEKLLGETDEADEIMRHCLARRRVEQGYSVENTRRKMLSLEGVLVPVSDSWNRDLLNAAGFRVSCFWRWMNFAAYLALKP